MAPDLVQAEVVEGLQDREEADAVARQLRIRGPEDERLVALIGAIVEERRGLGIGPGNDDARDPHDVELEAGGVESPVLLVLAHENLAALVAALLCAGLLVLDVVARNTDLDEPTDQVPDVRVTPVTRVGVRDDEWAEVDLRRRSTLLLVHLDACEMLVLVGGQERPNQAGRLIGNLAERVAREVGTGILRNRTLRRGGPATEVDGLDPHPLHHHGLTGRVGAERRDLTALGEQLPESRIEPLGGRSRDRVVRLERSLLRSDLAGGMETHDPVEPGLIEPLARRGHLLLEWGQRRHGCRNRHRDRHSFAWSRGQSSGHSHSARKLYGRVRGPPSDPAASMTRAASRSWGRSCAVAGCRPGCRTSTMSSIG